MVVKNWKLLLSLMGFLPHSDLSALTAMDQYPSIGYHALTCPPTICVLLLQMMTGSSKQPKPPRSPWKDALD
jgi:hypothetical protein